MPADCVVACHRLVFARGRMRRASNVAKPITGLSPPVIRKNHTCDFGVSNLLPNLSAPKRRPSGRIPGVTRLRVIENPSSILVSPPLRRQDWRYPSKQAGWGAANPFCLQAAAREALIAALLVN